MLDTGTRIDGADHAHLRGVDDLVELGILTVTTPAPTP